VHWYKKYRALIGRDWRFLLKKRRFFNHISKGCGCCSLYLGIVGVAFSSVWLGLFFVVLSVIFIKKSYDLPIREALLMAKEHNNKMSVALLTVELGCDIEEAKKIIEILSRENLITLTDEIIENGEEVYELTRME